MLVTLLLTAATLLGTSSEPDTTVRLPRGGSIEITTHLEHVIVRGGTSDAVIVRGASVAVDHKDVTIFTSDLLSGHAGNVEVTLPSWARLTVSTYTGNVTIEGAPVRVEVETFTGVIRVSGGTGRLDLQSAAGSITVTDFKGESLNADATGDNITVANATGRIEVASVNGAVRLRGIRSSSVNAESVSGLIEYEGPLAAEGRYNFESHAGGITLMLPADVSASLRISTFSGRFLNQIPATRPTDRSEDGDSDFLAILGQGSAKVTIDSFSGDIRIVKATPP